MKDSVYILAGGESLTGFDFNKLENKDVIAVNKSILSYPKAKYFITMDFTALKKMDFKNIVCDSTKIFIANFTFDYIKEIDGRITDTRFGLVYKLEDFDMIIKSYYKMFFGDNFNIFSNGQNSAFCALQLAIVLGYKNIYLLGLDLTCKNKTHFHSGYGQDIEKFKKSLDEYYSYFYHSILKFKEKSDINIYSCSKISRLNYILKYKAI